MWHHLLRIYEESQLNAGPPACLFAETLIFNEGWLLRSVLRRWKAVSERATAPYARFPPDATIYSEGMLPTPFKPRWRGDPKGETHTHVDGLAGHFGLMPGTKAGIALSHDCRYIALFEAKLYSPLSRGTRNAPRYNQVSRTTACLIHGLLQADVTQGFEAQVIVLYPEDNGRITPEAFDKDHIRKQIAERLAGYAAAGPPTAEIARFEERWQETLDAISIRSETWEAVLADLGDDGLSRFYGLCKRFNG